MPWSQWLEPKKQEVLDHALRHVSTTQADDDITAFEGFLGVLQQGHECLLGAFAQLLSGHVHVQATLPQDGVPRWNALGTGTWRTRDRR